MVGHGEARRAAIIPQDITVIVLYPESGECGKTISYVEIQSTQLFRFGGADILDGGIGQRHIKIRVVAKLTIFIDVVASIYGY